MPVRFLFSLYGICWWVLGSRYFLASPKSMMFTCLPQTTSTPGTSRNARTRHTTHVNIARTKPQQCSPACAPLLMATPPRPDAPPEPDTHHGATPRARRTTRQHTACNRDTERGCLPRHTQGDFCMPRYVLRRGTSGKLLLRTTATTHPRFRRRALAWQPERDRELVQSAQLFLAEPKLKLECSLHVHSCRGGRGGGHAKMRAAGPQGTFDSALDQGAGRTTRDFRNERE